MSEKFDRSLFLNKFTEEALEHLKNLNQNLLALEKDPESGETLAEMFRVVHTLKGSARMVGTLEIAEIAHKMEDLLKEIEAKRVGLTESVSDLLFVCFDSIQLLLETTSHGQPSGVEVEKLCQKLTEAAKGEREPKVPTEGEKAKAEKVVGRRAEDRAESVRISIAKLDKLISLVAEMVISQIKLNQSLGEVKNLTNLSKEQAKLWRELQLKIKTPELAEQINKLASFNSQMHRGTSNLFRNLAERVTQSDLDIRELRQETMDLRMLPLVVVFDVFPRVVRDMAKEYGKEIRLIVSGADTRLDRKILEKVNDPLIHLMRNAIDHGIEMPEQRAKLGKPREGRIELTACEEGDHVLIQLTDDGAGIDFQKVKQAAVNKGHRNKSEEITDQDAINLLFSPGFSTSGEVTEVSGRGVGLDVVKKNVEELKGTVSLSSEVNQGTKVTLRLPLTLAITRALLVKVGGETFALPTPAIEEILTLPDKEIHSLGGKKMISYRASLLPLIRMAEVLSLRRKEELIPKEKIVVVLSSACGQLGFLVDELVAEQEIVIHSLGNHLKRAKNIAGATILGSGEVVAIVHIPELACSAQALVDKRREEEPISEDLRVPVG